MGMMILTLSLCITSVFAMYAGQGPSGMCAGSPPPRRKTHSSTVAKLAIIPDSPSGELLAADLKMRVELRKRRATGEELTKDEIAVTKQMDLRMKKVRHADMERTPLEKNKDDRDIMAVQNRLEFLYEMRKDKTKKRLVQDEVEERLVRYMRNRYSALTETGTERVYIILEAEIRKSELLLDINERWERFEAMKVTLENIDERNLAMKEIEELSKKHSLPIVVD